MAGGLLQLVAYGSENQYLNGNPQLTFFKMVYRRYTNFAMQSISVNFEGLQSLNYNRTVILKTTIPRNADLVSHMFLAFDIPDIYADSNNLFRWIKYLGSYMVNWVKIYIGGTLIEQLYGEYIDMYHQLNIENNQLDAYNKMIGNEPAYNNPTDARGLYPTYSVNKKSYYDPSGVSINMGYNSKPTIVGKRIYVPLPFWFHKHIGLAIPLIALQYHEVTLEVELKAIQDIYLVGSINTLTTDKAYYYNPIDASGNTDPSGVTNNVDSLNYYHWRRPTNTLDEIINFTNLNTNVWALTPTLEINYIFLDESERKIFANNTHSYLIEKVVKYDSLGCTGSKIIEVEVYHPVKEIIMVAQRDDVRDRNDWSNFTSLDNAEMNPYDYQTYLYNVSKQVSPNSPFTVLGCFRTDEFRINDVLVYRQGDPTVGGGDYAAIHTIVDPTSDKLYATKTQAYTNADMINFLNLWEFRDPSGQIPSINKQNYSFFDGDIIENIEINFNGNIRLDQKDNTYFQDIQPYIHHPRHPRKGILLYSFCIDPSKYQPSGACNFSHIKKVEFNILFKNPTTYETSPYNNVKYNMYYYLVSYNIIQIMGGMGSLMYAN